MRTISDYQASSPNHLFELWHQKAIQGSASSAWGSRQPCKRISPHPRASEWKRKVNSYKILQDSNTSQLTKMCVCAHLHYSSFIWPPNRFPVAACPAPRVPQPLLKRPEGFERNVDILESKGGIQVHRLWFFHKPFKDIETSGQDLTGAMFGGPKSKWVDKPHYPGANLKLGASGVKSANKGQESQTWQIEWKESTSKHTKAHQIWYVLL